MQNALTIQLVVCVPSSFLVGLWCMAIRTEQDFDWRQCVEGYEEAYLKDTKKICPSIDTYLDPNRPYERVSGTPCGLQATLWITVLFLSSKTWILGCVYSPKIYLKGCHGPANGKWMDLGGLESSEVEVEFGISLASLMLCIWVGRVPVMWGSTYRHWGGGGFHTSPSSLKWLGR